MNAPLISTSTATPYEVWFAPHAQLGGKSLMDHLYNMLDGAYPHKWRSNFPGPEAIDNWKCSWVEAFESEGITPDQIQLGLKACRSRYDWPPSCAEFIKACRPSVDPLVAYYEAVAGVAARSQGEVGSWSHPAVYWAAMPLAFDLGSQTYAQIKVRWERALAESAALGAWEPIPAPHLALPAPGKGELSKEAAAKMLDQLGAGNVVKKATQAIDHKRWARVILERAASGDTTVSMVQLHFAKQALGQCAV